MKLSQKFKKKIKKNLMIVLVICAVISSTLATFKLTNISEPINNLATVTETTQSLSNNAQTASTEITIADDGAIVCDSIVQGVRDCDLTDGNYIFRVTGTVDGTQETKDYAVELINYYDDVTYSLADGETSKTISLGDTTSEYKMLVVKYHKNLTIDKGVTVTATNVSNLTYKKGMYLCVMGELKNKGTITMTARGTYNQAGENVYLWKNIDESYEYIPAIGGSGGTRVGGYNSNVNGKPGTNGINRATGGGGSGGAHGGNCTAYSGAGAAGTSYSGGSGGGAASRRDSNGNGTAATANGGAGGNGTAYQSGSYNKTAGGGAGNTGGRGARYGGNGGAAYNGENGTGGLMILYADTFSNMGTISSNGSKGGDATASWENGYSWGIAGGSSGAGSINIFTNKVNSKSTINATGGASVSSNQNGGAGGNGSITINQLKPDLNYTVKTITIDINESYKLNKNELSYINQNGIQTQNISLGSVSYEILDESVATVDSNGNITAVSEGSTKVKITDTTNSISTYIYLEVINSVKVDVQEGKSFTIALKQNGTVWSYGLNDNGQLGIGNNENKAEPTKISNINNVKAIATGYSHALALLQNGDVYSWGLGTSGQLGNGSESNSNVPVKVDGIWNIVKIDSYKNTSIALSSDGKVYVWGEGYSTLPMRVVFSENVVDISGTLMLTEKGQVYSITDTSNSISGLSNIAKISSGEAHYLALDVNGMVYSWGTNTYGECGTATTGTINVIESLYGMYEISAGNGISIIQDENKKIYGLGNNANGQLGLASVAKVTTLTEIALTEEIENISSGEGTHSGIVDTNGFVWHTGTNTYGELGISNNTAQTTFIKTGDTVLNTDQKDKIYIDLNESVTINSRLENTFNLKIDLIDNVQSNFEITLSNTEKLAVQGNTLTAKEYGTTIVTITHIETGTTKELQISVTMKMDSIVQGLRDAELSDGQYEILVQDQVYSVELINYYDDVVYSLDEGETEKTISLGDDSTEYKMLVVKYHKNLTIDKGVTVTATTVNNLTYKKGMYLCVLGNVYNNGTISMTARGTYNQEGEDVYLWKNIDDSYEYVPAIGGAGGSRVGGYDFGLAGNPGSSGSDRSTGGGGSGGGHAGASTGYSGAGAAGTSYSGGSGGGALSTRAANRSATDAQPNGGAGGNGAAYQPGSYNKTAGGGAGNTGGIAARYGGNNGTAYNGENGTGGLAILYTNDLYNSGTISSNGSKGGDATASWENSYSWGAAGGSSGGGSINIFANLIQEYGTVTAAGGQSVSSNLIGGAGGNGSVTINELGSVLNYAKKKLELNIKDTYTIDKSKLSYTKLNEIQTEDLSLGNITYQSLDQSIATVDNTGKITGITVGKTKIKITDETNGYSTYIIVTVTKQGLVTPQIKEGTDFTIALKANGTVWSYGLNDNGQLGNNSTVNSNEPIQVLTEDLQNLKNIIDIGAGYKSGIALTKNGEVYTWGQHTYLDSEGNSQTKNRIVATKENTLNNIIKVDSYKNNFYAVDADGNAYIWGEGYSNPTKIETTNAIEDVSGDLLLGQDGRVYLISNPTVAIQYLSSICEISCGENHYLFVTLEGYIYSLGKGDLGQLGNGTFTESNVPVFVKTQEGCLTDVSSISAGAKTSMAVTYDGKVFVWGDNTNKKLGIVDTKTSYATQITSVQDKEGNTIELKQMEIVEAGLNHSSISDKNGYVYMVGLNTNGQLGTEDNTNRGIFTKIGIIEIVTKPENINIPVNTTQNIAVALSNSFNLKGDIPEEGEVKLNNTNTKEVTIQKIESADNSETTNINEFLPNYTITGNKIGRANLVATSNEGYEKNIWVNVVNSEDVEVAAKVVNGNGFTITLRSDGTVWSFGKNASGQLGLSHTNNTNKPEKIEIQEQIIDISSGENHTLLLGKSGTVYSFGVNSNGQLGIGNTTNYKVPVKIGISNIEKVIAKSKTSFAITSSGEVYAWGYGYTKVPTLLQITKTVETDEVDEEGNSITVQENQNIIDIGLQYYLSDDGIVRKLSDNTEINLSINEYEPTEEPVIVNEKIVQISEGIDHLLLLAESGRVYTYGKNVYGQLGDSTTIARENNITTVARVEDGSILENIAEVSAGDKYSIAVSIDGKVYTFGINGEMQLGFDNEIETGGIQESGYARLKEDITSVERVTAGYTHTSIYKENGDVYTWGQGEQGQLGNGDNFNYYEPQIVGKNIIETNINEILIELESTFDLDAEINYFNLFEEKESEVIYEVLDTNLALINSQTGEIMGIGTGRTTVLAKEVGTDKIAVIPLTILPKGTKPESVNILIKPQAETAGSHTITLKVDGTVWCYGIGTYGELGTGKEEISDEPVQAVFPEGTIITKIAAGENHCLALDSEGNVWSWGRNNYYQLGNSTDTNLLVPTKITGLSNIKDISAGTYTSFAIGEAGEVYSWGLNANGEGGIGSYTNKITVTKAKNVTDAIDIKAGKNHTIILKSTGEVLVTGSNLYGELGTNNTLRKTNEFTKVETLNNVVAISTGDSNNTVIKTDGSVYSWGANIYKELGTQSTSTAITEPTKVEGLKDIRYIDGGKGYQLVINSSNEVFVNGLNSSGELGNNSKTNQSSYTKLTTIDDVINVSAGNVYTVMVKSDGTVWGCGDYTHGDENIKSRTKSIIPVQVGNDQTNLGKTQITLNINAQEEIAANCSYEFNLISLNDNFADTLSYISLNEKIATVDENGIVTGIRAGTTRVNATSNIDGKIYSILVYVIPEDNQSAPKVESGENFAVVLKGDGSVWSFGYNTDGRLSIGNSLTKDIPVKTNILATYEDIKAGKDFVLALRSDGKVWSVGNNKYGQLGNGTTTSKNKFAQIQGLEDIVKIEAGEDFGIAIDSYGIVYVWGNNSNGQLGSSNSGNIIITPIAIQTGSQKVIDISAGSAQSVFVTAKGTIFGYGNLLNGTLSGIENAIKAQVTNDSIIILTSNFEVFEYKNGTLSQINISEKVIDISASNGTVMYQTVDEKTYVSGENTYGQLGTGNTQNVDTPVLANKHNYKTFTIGAGYYNTYMIETTGNVYAAGNNEYGSIGNGTRASQLEHILVGDRIFKVEPEASTMYAGDIEEIVITGEPFNVFGNTEISSDEYDWITDDETVVSIEPGILTAEAEGTAHIQITDKITSESITITRIVIPQDSDRIAKITVNNEQAILDETSTEEDIKYKVQVVTNDNTGVLNITTNNLTDRISIDGGMTWSYNGTFNGEINLTDKITEIPIIVGVQNNTGEYPTELTYTLIVEKITDDIGIKQITVTSIDDTGAESTINAVPVSLTRYEVAVAEPTNVSLVNVIANSEYSSISIDGLEYTLKEQNKNIIIGNELTKEVKISVKSEAGTETEYTLVIYKENEIMNLLSLTVNDEQATKISEGTYAITVSKDTDLAKIVATTESSLASISIANNTYTAKINTTELNIESDTTVVTIKVKVDNNIKEYTLYIYKEQESENIPKLNMLMVNGTVIEPEEDKLTYIAYLPSAETEATIRAIAKESTTTIKIADNTEETGDSQAVVQIPNNENTYKVLLTDNEGNSSEYTVIISKAESDASIDKIYVSNGDTDIDAKLQDDGTYLVKVLNDYTNVDVTAITGYTKAKVQVADTGVYVEQRDTQNVTLDNNETTVKIKVQSQDGTNEKEYILNIVKLSNNADLLKIEVDGTEATIGDDGNYRYTLLEAKNNVSVKAITNAVSPTEAYVKIENTEYVLYEMTKQVDITAKQTEVQIKVKAEDGSVKDYTLIIEGLPDDTNIEKVTVNGKQATYIEGQNRFEVRSEDTEFNIEVTLSDLLASMVLGDNPKAIGTDSITITKIESESETQVKVTVTSQNGLEVQEYIIAILEKSNNTNLDILKVNDVTINPDAEGNYKTTIKNSITQIKVDAIAEDTYATTTINETANNSYIASITESVVEGTTIYNYKITIIAEDGSTKDYNLEVEQLEANTNITSVLVGKDEMNFEEAVLKEDGSYYYKIDRVENAFINVNLESSKSTVNINGEIGSVVNVQLPDEINTFTIEVIAEDGTSKEVSIVIEKKSNDLTIKSITGQDILETDIQEEMAYVYVDEDVNSVDLSITLTNSLSKLKLDTETDYGVNSITRTVDLSDYATSGVVNLNLMLQAEDGSEKAYTVSICKLANLDLSSVVVNSDTLIYDEENEKYFKLVSYGNTPEIIITPSNTNQTVQLLDTEGNVLIAATGVLTTTQTLSTTDLTTKYIIKVISHNGEDYGVKEYNLEIRQKSQETGITYIKVDSLGTSVSEDKLTYSSTVAGKDKYPVEIKLKNENAKVKVQDADGNVLINEQTGVLTGELTVPDGEKEVFTVIVTSENGEEKTYTLSIERISSNLNIEQITVTDYDTDGVTVISKNVVDYNANTKTYKVLVSEGLAQTDVTINTVSSFTNIVADSVVTGKGTVTLNKQLIGLGVNEVIIELTAADGTQDTRYLQILQLSDEIGIQTVEVDGVVINPNDVGDYETTVTNENDLSQIKVTLPVDTSTVSINGTIAQSHTSTVNVSKGNNRVLNIPIKVTAEDGTTYTYKLILNIISHDTSVQTVKVDGVDSTFVKGEDGADGKYVAYFSKDALQANIEVIAGVQYSSISHQMEDGTEVSGIEKINFILNTSDLTQKIYTTTFKVKAEDGTEKEYTLECIRKSDDSTIGEVYVNDIELQPNSGHLEYADGTYYIAVTQNTAKVKVSANNEFATVSFAEKSGTQVLEQTITLDTNNKVTEVPVTITSQQGTTTETTIYIEKVSDNNNLTSVKVNYELVQNTEIENKFLSYIYDTVTTAKVEIIAENEYANIIRVTENGETYLDENGLSSQAKGTLTMDIETPENITIIYFKIVAECGLESPIYTVQIEKMSTDATLKEIYVDGILIEPNEDGKYIANVLDTVTNPVVKAVTNHSLAYVRIALGDEYLNISEQSVTMSSNKQTIIPITVRSQSGITKVTYLYINKISTSVKLNTVTIDDKEADSYNDSTNTYRFLVEDTKTEFELFVLAESDYTILEYEGVEYEASFKSVVSMEPSAEGKTLLVKAKSESGAELTYTIELAHKSDITDLEYLKVNDIERQPDEAGGDTYTVIIPKLATTTLLEVKTVHDYATVRLGDNQVVTSHDRGELDCSDLEQDRILVPVVVTAADGTTIRTYNIMLIRGSNDTSIELKVNDEIIEQDENGNYSTKVLYGEDIKIDATALNEGITGVYASIDINTTGNYETPSKQVTITSEEYGEKEKLQVPIQIKAEDGTLKESILTIEIIDGTYITGKITTENVNGEYISEVTVYKTSDTSNPRQELVKVQTEPDGTFKALIHQMSDTIIDENANGIADELEENYDIVVTKKGYLNYTVTNIGVKEAQETILDEYKLIAGDVVETGEIEIDDLVLLNDNIGVVITEENKESKAIYDLNEDGNIDILDRNILKANYHKKSETIEWVDPNAVTTYALSTMSLDDNLECAQSVNSNGYILPMTCDYRISSNYGYRVHPVSGETKLHSGIDIVGTWHTEILAVEDGEITYAGVQNGYGNCIEIKHIVNGETIYTFYAHLSEIKVSVGDKVSQGQVIALEGGDASDPNPGTSTGHHLHFEFRSASGSGHSLDPNNYIDF